MGHNCQNGMSDFIISETRKRLEKRHGFIVVCPGFIIHAIIDIIVDRMIPEIECRVQEVQNVENLVFTLSGKSQTELLQRLINARNGLIVCQSRLWPKSTITHSFCDEDWRIFLGGVQQQFWNDINDHVARMVDLLNMGQKTLETAQNVFVAKISLEMANQANDFSETAGRFTAIGSIFLPLTFFTGVWGMNCKVPFQYEGPDTLDIFTDDFYGFVIVVSLMLFTAISTYRLSLKML